MHSKFYLVQLCFVVVCCVSVLYLLSCISCMLLFVYIRAYIHVCMYVCVWMAHTCTHVLYMYILFNSYNAVHGIYAIVCVCFHIVVLPCMHECMDDMP